MGALRAGSIPGMGDFFFFYGDGGRATQVSAKRKCQRARMSAANVGASSIYRQDGDSNN